MAERSLHLQPPVKGVRKYIAVDVHTPRIQWSQSRYTNEMLRELRRQRGVGPVRNIKPIVESILTKAKNKARRAKKAVAKAAAPHVAATSETVKTITDNIVAFAKKAGPNKPAFVKNVTPAYVGKSSMKADAWPLRNIYSRNLVA